MAKVKPELRGAARSFVAGGVVLILLIGVLLVTVKAPTGLPFQPSTIVVAEFTNVHSLLENADVRRNSKRIGRVAKLEVRGDHALVTMQLDGRHEVYRDARASIWDTSGLAAKFVELDFGTPAAGTLGEAVIPASVNQDSSDLYQLLDVFDPVTRTAAAGSLREVGGGAAGHGADLHDLLAAGPVVLPSTGTVATDLRSPEFGLPRLIKSADRLSTRFAGRERQISDLVAQADATFRAISVDDGAALAATLAKAPDTLRTVTPALDALNAPLADTASAMRDLEPGARALGGATADLRGFLRDSAPVLDKVPDVSDQAKPSLGDLSDTMSDARPLAPKLRDGLDGLAPPLRLMAPIAPEIATLFVRGHSFTSQGPDATKRYAKLNIAPNVDGVTTTRVSYPKPGEAPNHRFTGPLGGLAAHPGGQR